MCCGRSKVAGRSQEPIPFEKRILLRLFRQFVGLFHRITVLDGQLPRFLQDTFRVLPWPSRVSRKKSLTRSESFRRHTDTERNVSRSRRQLSHDLPYLKPCRHFFFQRESLERVDSFGFVWKKTRRLKMK